MALVCLPEIRGGGGRGHNDVARVQRRPSANQTSGLRRRRAKSNGLATIRFAGGVTTTRTSRGRPTALCGDGRVLPC